jgi:uncharacterized protein
VTPLARVRETWEAVMKTLFVALGVLSLTMGIVGIFVPGIPTTEFVLAASYLFARSSPRLQHWLESNRWFGPTLRRFRETRGMPRKTKMLAIASMWIGLGVSIYALASIGVGAQIAAAMLGLMGTGTILFVVRTTAARQSLILS